MTARLAHTPADQTPNSTSVVNKFGLDDSIPSTLREWRNYYQEVKYQRWREERANSLIESCWAQLVAASVEVKDGDSAIPRSSGQDLDGTDLFSLEEVLPAEYGRRLQALSPIRRQAGIEGINRHCDVSDIMLLVMSHQNPLLIAGTAELRAEEERERQWRAGGNQFTHDGEWALPSDPDSMRARDRRTHLRSIKSRLRHTDLYLSAACGAISARLGTPYASDFTLAGYRDQLRSQAAILDKLVLVRRDDPTKQIGAKEMAEKSAVCNAAMLRTLIDMEAFRGRVNGMFLSWVTLTLPGEYVPVAIDETKRTSVWNPDYHLRAGDEEIQHLWAQIRAICAKRDIDLSGLWAPQAQNSGTQHRHLALWSHTLEAARLFCDIVRDKFNTEENPAACAAFVIGDEDTRYSDQRRRQSQRTETVETVFQYLSRYATRETVEADIDSSDPKVVKRLRHQAIAAGRWRSFNFLGTRNSAKGIWKTCYRAMLRGESGICPRSKRAIHHMRRSDEAAKECARLRELIRAMHEVPHLRDELERHLKMSQRHAATHAYFAALCLGHWRSLTAIEQRWIDRRFKDVAAPEPHFEVRKNRYGQSVRRFVGIREAWTNVVWRRLQSYRENWPHKSIGHEPLAILRMVQHEWDMVDEEEAANRVAGCQLAKVSAQVDRVANLIIQEKTKAEDGAENAEVLLHQRQVIPRTLQPDLPIIKVTDVLTDPSGRAAPDRGTVALPPGRAATPPEPPPGRTLAA